MATNSAPIKIDGLAELAADLPDDGTYELRVAFRKAAGDQAEVIRWECWKIATPGTPGEQKM